MLPFQVPGSRFRVPGVQRSGYRFCDSRFHVRGSEVQGSGSAGTRNWELGTWNHRDAHLVNIIGHLICEISMIFPVVAERERGRHEEC